MATALAKLVKLCNDLPAQIDRAANDIAKGAAVAIAENVIAHTPVDVTTAVSNWQANVNSPADFELPAIYPGEYGSTAPQSRRAALAHVKRVVKTKDPGEPLFLSNVTPYIEDLNNGSSRQEPAGMVERAVLVGEQYVKGAKVDIKW